MVVETSQCQCSLHNQKLTANGARIGARADCALDFATDSESIINTEG
jgi:hypothetical protein